MSKLQFLRLATVTKKQNQQHSVTSSQPRALFRSPTSFHTIFNCSLANILGRKIVNVQYRWCSSLV